MYVYLIWKVSIKCGMLDIEKLIHHKFKDKNVKIPYDFQQCLKLILWKCTRVSILYNTKVEIMASELNSMELKTSRKPSKTKEIFASEFWRSMKYLIAITWHKKTIILTGHELSDQLSLQQAGSKDTTDHANNIRNYWKLVMLEFKTAIEKSNKVSEEHT